MHALQILKIFFFITSVALNLIFYIYFFKAIKIRCFLNIDPDSKLENWPKIIQFVFKLTLARRYLHLLDKVEPGITRNRVKTIFDAVDVTLFLIQVFFLNFPFSLFFLSYLISCFFLLYLVAKLL